jgi:uncharacterized protein
MNKCKGCDLCCRYVVIEIDKPKTEEDFDEIVWFLVHKNVRVFIDNDNSWNLQFDSACEKLKGGKCSIYDKRPSICRKYSTESCEKYGAGKSYKKLWKTSEEFIRWRNKNKKLLI